MDEPGEVAPPTIPAGKYYRCRCGRTLGPVIMGAVEVLAGDFVVSVVCAKVTCLNCGAVRVFYPARRYGRNDYRYMLEQWDEGG